MFTRTLLRSLSSTLHGKLGLQMYYHTLRINYLQHWFDYNDNGWKESLDIIDTIYFKWDEPRRMPFNFAERIKKIHEILREHDDRDCQSYCYHEYKHILLLNEEDKYPIEIKSKEIKKSPYWKASGPYYHTHIYDPNSVAKFHWWVKPK